MVDAGLKRVISHLGLAWGKAIVSLNSIILPYGFRLALEMISLSCVHTSQTACSLLCQIIKNS